MIQSYGQPYDPSSPDSGSIGEESQVVEAEFEFENALQPHVGGELFDHCILQKNILPNYNKNITIKTSYD